MKLKNLLNYDRLHEFLNAPMEYFQQFGKVQQTPDGILIHHDIGANILGVAHLDSVNPHDHFYVNKFAGDDIVFSTRLDDRLGAYIILDLLPAMGIHTDILLTEGEEKGKSTAKHFKTDKQYHWMFSFDRHENDAVYYRYYVTNWIDAIRKIFGNPSHGSNSDIDYLSELKCCGVNVGTGYFNEHHLMAHANMSMMLSQVGKFIQFYQQNRRIRYPFQNSYTPAKTYKDNNFGYSYGHSYTPPVTPPKSEETEEEDIYEVFNPYEGMPADVPLDIIEYTDADGVIDPPPVCEFCMGPLGPENTHIFMGICSGCEPWAVQCPYCHRYVCRQEDPEDWMVESEMFYGICCICAEKYKKRRHDEDSGFQDSGNKHEHGNNPDSNSGDENDLVYN